MGFGRELAALRAVLLKPVVCELLSVSREVVQYLGVPAVLRIVQRVLLLPLVLGWV